MHFHDGTPFTSADAVFSFDRRKGVDSAPEYMVADVTSMATPTPYTFIVHLSQPVAAFLDYMASPYGPKMVSEQTVVGTRDRRASRATGPRDGSRPTTPGRGRTRSSAFVPGSHYILVARTRVTGE